MPIATRTFRVFVSSTFEDLTAERDALQRDVFPRLRKLCEANNARFQAIDLRWGVRDEAALDQQTMEICLREIERCQQTGIKPNFIVLLGERYGWRPLPARIEATEFEQVLSVASYADRQRLLWEESPTGSRGWYRLDLNAVPSEYILRPRELNIPADASEADQQAARDHEAADWKLTEKELQQIFSSAIARLNWPADDPRRIKYEASATHQEILKGLGHSDEERKHVFAFFRGSAEGTTIDPELNRLKQELSDKLPEENILPFSASDLAKLCSDVERKLSAVILSEADRFKPQHALDLEIAEHETFARDRASHFRGRVSVLEAIKNHIRSGEIRPLVVHGPSGCGKSAIMARAANLAKDWAPGAQRIERFIGVTPDSSNGATLLTSLCRQLSRVYGVTEETPIGFQPLVSAFHERMARATAERPLVLFIDALDQLRSDDEARSFSWLRQNLPPHVSLIVSATEIPAGLTHAVQVEVQDFRVEEADEVLAAWFAAAKPERKLQPEQREKVLGSFAQSESRLPLYLKLAFEEARRWRSFQPLETCELGSDAGSMIDVLFNRLSEETNHGPVLVNRSLGFLAAARYGLSEDEMLDVLTADDAVWQDFESRAHHKPPARQLPVIVWSRLFLDLEPYLNERAAPGGTVIAFYHRQLAERVTANLLAGDKQQARHSDLARFFYTKTPWLDEGHKTPNARRAAELPFQQRKAQQWAEAESTLLDCPFLFAKVAAGMVLDLDDDYQALLQEAPQSELHCRDTVRLLQGTLGLSLHVLARDWAQFGTQVRGRLLAHQDKHGIAGFLRELDSSTPRPRLRLLWPTLQAAGGPALRVLEGHTDRVNGIALTSDGKRVVSASKDKTVRIWDLQDNRPSRVLNGHTDEVWAVALSADGTRAVSGSADRTLRVWDIEGNGPPRVLEGHMDEVWAVALSANGMRAVSGSSDGTLRVWDIDGNQPPRVLEGHGGGVHSVALTADGKQALSCSDFDAFALRLWDLESNQLASILEGHTDPVVAVALAANGKLAISGAKDNTVRFWDLEGSQSPCVLKGHEGWVNAVSLTANGKRGLSGSSDHTLRVWDLDGGQSPRVLVGHADKVLAVVLTADGNCAVSGSSDNTVRVWDLESSHPSQANQAGPIFAVALTADGKRAIFGSWNLRVWDLDSNRPARVLEDNMGYVRVALSADGKRAVSGSWDGIRVWDLDSNQPPRAPEGYAGHVEAVALTPDGMCAVSSSSDNRLRVWDLDSGRPPRVLEGHPSIRAVALSADGKRAVSGSWDSMRVWDLSGNQPPRVLECGALTVKLTADGRRAISGSWDGMVRIWDLSSRRPPRVLRGHTDDVNAVVLSVEGARAVSGSTDQTLKVWDLESETCLVTFACDFPIFSCAWEGGRIVAGDEGGQIHLFAWDE